MCTAGASEDWFMREKIDDWLLATTIMFILSFTTFMTQRFVLRVLDPMFETCVFYIPTTVLSLIYVKLRLEKKTTR